jgi:peptidyl-prolyl cis-trans isomerase D
MLNSIKDKTKGWGAYLIVSLITIPFSLFGVSEYFMGTSNIIVASVGSDDISKETYLKEFDVTKRRLQKELGESYTAELNHRVKLSTIQSMVNRRFLEQLADELTKNQIKYNFLDSAFVTPSALKRIHLLNEQQRKFSYIMLNTKEYTNKVEVDSKNIRKFFYKNKQDYFEPQKVKVNFNEFSTKKVVQNIKVNDDDLFNLYQDDKAHSSTEEKRKVQHILVESEKLSNTIVAQLKQGESFAGLAAKYSKDTSSKDSGGSLGFFTVGVMAPKFEAKVFAMKEDEVSAPVKTDFSYHIIKLNKIKIGKVSLLRCYIVS